MRDGRAPVPIREATSKVMSANRGRDTGPEISLRRALWAAGLRGYRINVRGLPGRPDIVFPRQHLAIFVHGCFWHRCPHCQVSAPKTHVEFWREKFERNRARDARNIEELNDLGWRTMTVWECEVKAEIQEVVRSISLALKG